MATPVRFSVQLVDVSKTFAGGVSAVDGISLAIGEGEFFSLLGPSGSGKTTVLRMIAGFEQPTSGRILLDGADVTDVPPFERDVNTVFQDYALFPHMTVQENVEYGLRVKGVGKAERRVAAAEMLETVRLGNYGDRRPNQLSGGQRQRVAVARALVNHPKVLLLDEPLGALDLKLREQMQVELKGIQHEVGITFVFVTHDQGEALSMSTRIAVFNQGRVEQVGSPREVYSFPATEFVADFVGTSNLIDAEASHRLFDLAEPHSVRPEQVRLHDGGDDANEIVVPGTVLDVLFLGAENRVQVACDGIGTLVARVRADVIPAVGTTVELAWPRHAAFPVVGKRALQPIRGNETLLSTDTTTNEMSTKGEP